ncbi:MAG TPA: D-2-hydroxyacid dehydrogenase [Thermodesulfobacteriota bacterium]
MKVLVYNRMAKQYRSALAERAPELTVVAGYDEALLREHIGDADVLLTFRFPTEYLAQAKRLRWIQLTSAGAEQVLAAPQLRRDVVVTNTRGIHGDVMAEYAAAVMLALRWRLPALVRDQQARRWRPALVRPLAGATLGVVGLGAIGGAIARQGASLGMRVLGVRRTPAPVDGVERVYGPDGLLEMLPECDFVVLVVPTTSETTRMIGAAELAAMKPTACLVNVARGSVVDEAALVAALREGRLGGAALDVFDEEPLPPGSPFWDLENVLVTPHISGMPVDYWQRVLDVFLDNVARWRAGQPLRNRVDPERGY